MHTSETLENDLRVLWQEKGCCGKSLVCETYKGNSKKHVCVCVNKKKDKTRTQKKGTFNDVQLHLYVCQRKHMLLTI